MGTEKKGNSVVIGADFSGVALLHVVSSAEAKLTRTLLNEYLSDLSSCVQA